MYNYDTNVLHISIYGSIGGWMNNQDQHILSEIEYVAAFYPESTIRLTLNTEGGDVGKALTLYNALKGCGIPITCYLLGYVFSAGTIIACAADRVVATRSTIYMIHESGVVLYNGRYNKENMTRQAKKLGAFNDTMAAIYADKTGLEIEAVNDLMAQETYMTAETALEYGFVDEIVAGAQGLGDYYLMPPEEIAMASGEVGVVLASGEVVKAKAMQAKDNLSTPSKTTPMKFLNDLKESLMSVITKIDTAEGNSANVTATAGQPPVASTNVVEKITAQLDAVEASIQASIDNAVQERVTAMVSAWDTQREQTIANQKNEISALKDKVSASASSIDALKTEIAAMKTAPVNASAGSNGQPPVQPSEGEQPVDNATVFLNALGIQPM